MQLASSSPLVESVRAQYTPAAVRGFLALAEQWSLSEAQQLTLLGASISRPTLGVWKQRGARTTLNVDQFTRISLLLGIFEGLERFFRQTPIESERWLRRPRTGHPFDGRSALDTLLEGGIRSFEEVRAFIDSAAGGPISRAS